MSTSLASLALAASLLGQTQNALPAETDEFEVLQRLKDESAAIALGPIDQPAAPLAQTPEAVLRYSNPLGGGQGGSGATYLWLAGKRPVAALSLSLRPADRHIYLEASLFRPAAVVCRRQDTVFWTPKSKEPLIRTLDDGPAPAAGKAQRLVQMRNIARQFSACTFTQTEARSDLRLLTSPLYRYAAEEDGVLDGAVFAFAVANDPELLLLLEATRSDGGETPAAWQYALCPMSSRRQTVRFADDEVESIESFYRQPAQGRQEGRYVEKRLGAIAP